MLRLLRHDPRRAVRLQPLAGPQCDGSLPWLHGHSVSFLPLPLTRRERVTSTRPVAYTSRRSRSRRDHPACSIAHPAFMSSGVGMYGARDSCSQPTHRDLRPLIGSPHEQRRVGRRRAVTAASLRAHSVRIRQQRRLHWQLIPSLLLLAHRAP